MIYVYNTQISKKNIECEAHFEVISQDDLFSRFLNDPNMVAPGIKIPNNTQPISV